jgi:hypothetical protein
MKPQNQKEFKKFETSRRTGLEGRREQKDEYKYDPNSLQEGSSCLGAGVNVNRTCESFSTTDLGRGCIVLRHLLYLSYTKTYKVHIKNN